MASITAYLDDYGKVIVNVSRVFFNGVTGGFYITADNGTCWDCVIKGVVDQDREVIYELTIPTDIEYGVQYYLHEQHGQSVPLQFRFIVRTALFEKEFTYENNDLGSFYHPGFTDFALWAPTAVEVLVKIHDHGKVLCYPMTRTTSGVFRVRVNQDLKEATYVYLVHRDGIVAETLDPYGLSSTANARESAVIDVDRIRRVQDPGVKKPLASFTDAIIYETSVRDMTSSRLTGTSTHGRFVSLLEEGTTWKGHKTGIDYLKSLGVTHVQFQPLNDFATVDEERVEHNYNWGYDPLQLLSLEGSYASDPNDPYARMIEFRKLVALLHRNDIRVNVDVVFNHMYDVSMTSLDKTLPYYYFRYNENGYMSNGSWCGNDLDSKRTMMRHLFLHVIQVMMRLYGVDGFRFDLMGIVDVDTMNAIAAKARSIKKDAMIYGEGWDMPTALSWDEKSTIYNQHKLHDIGHFNDTFRDVAKGRTADDQKYDKGYLTGKLEMAFDMCSVLAGNCLSDPYFLRFDSPVKTINAMETHDNATMWDKMHFCCSEEPRDVRTRRQKMLNATVMVSQGVAFLHAGQEFCGTKNDNSNSYNASDDINGMNWDRMIYNIDMLEYVKKAIRLRRTHGAFRLQTSQEIKNRVHFSIVDDHIVFYDIDYVENTSRQIRVMINPSGIGRNYHFDGAWKMIFDENGNEEVNTHQDFYLPPYTLLVLSNEDI